jgi:hypothetical protein
VAHHRTLVAVVVAGEASAVEAGEGLGSVGLPSSTRSRRSSGPFIAFPVLVWCVRQLPVTSVRQLRLWMVPGRHERMDLSASVSGNGLRYFGCDILVP